MTYSAREAGLQTGQPVELYEFRNGADAYRYTSANVDITYLGSVYEAHALARSSIEVTNEMARGALNINCARTLPVLALFRFAPPDEVVAVTVYRQHLGDADVIVAWMGRILSIALSGLEAVIHCESIYTSIKRTGLRRLYQKQCPHVLYSGSCGLSRSAYGVASLVSTAAALNLTTTDLGGFSSGYFAGGYVEWTQSSGQIERRAIRAHAGALVTLSFQMVGLAAGLLNSGYGLNYGNYYGGIGMTFYPGCDHSLATCAGKFANHLNYGGMPYIPQKNPFDGTPIY